VVSKKDEVADCYEPWESEHMKRDLCKVCRELLPELDGRPLHCELMSIPRSSLATLGGPQAWSPALYELLADHLRRYVAGKVTVVSATGRRTPTHYRTYYARKPDLLETDRGPECRHSYCRHCDRFYRRDWQAKPATLERYLDDRMVYLNAYGDVFLDQRLIDSIGKEEFPADIRFKNLPVLLEPADGQIMPGDAGWKGTFVELPIVGFDEP
jgi:hypothetical protein